MCQKSGAPPARNLAPPPRKTGGGVTVACRF